MAVCRRRNSLHWSADGVVWLGAIAWWNMKVGWMVLTDHLLEGCSFHSRCRAEGLFAPQGASTAAKVHWLEGFDRRC